MSGRVQEEEPGETVFAGTQAWPKKDKDPLRSGSRRIASRAHTDMSIDTYTKKKGGKKLKENNPTINTCMVSCSIIIQGLFKSNIKALTASAH